MRELTLDPSDWKAQPAPTRRNRLFSEVLPDGSWRGQPCFVIGGGPSRASINLAAVGTRPSIGINLEFLRRDPTVILSMDIPFIHCLLSGAYEAKYPGALSRFEESRALKAFLLTDPACQRIREDLLVIPVAVDYAYGLDHFVFDSRNGICHGNNSGFVALNLAVCLGANPIYLIGFDMKHSADGKTHWHEGHVGTAWHPDNRLATHLRSFIDYFRRWAPEIRRRGFEVYNVQRRPEDTALDCFPIVTPEEALREL